MGYTTSTDDTNRIIDNFPDPDNKIKVVHGQFKEKDDQCNAYMEHISPDIDYIWNLDSDEIFLPGDIEKMIKILEEEKYTSVGFKSLTFYGGFDRYLTGFEEGAEFIRIRKVYPGSFWRTHRPPTIQHVWNGPMLPEKHLNFEVCASKYGIRMYHYSYVFPRQVELKVKYYGQSLCPHLTIPDYFNRVYLPWVLGNDEEKNRVEEEFNGVHEYILTSRGPCRTNKFTGSHPNIILNSMSKLKEKFQIELEEVLSRRS
jgi:glycosyltransferase involved in cell wall biosynthesis